MTIAVKRMLCLEKEQFQSLFQDTKGDHHNLGEGIYLGSNTLSETILWGLGQYKTSLKTDLGLIYLYDIIVI